MISRRSVLLGLGAALAAPAVVRADDDRLKRVQQELKDAAALRSVPPIVWQQRRPFGEFLPIARSTPVVHT